MKTYYRLTHIDLSTRLQLIDILHTKIREDVGWRMLMILLRFLYKNLSRAEDLMNTNMDCTHKNRQQVKTVSLSQSVSVTAPQTHQGTYNPMMNVNAYDYTIL